MIINTATAAGPRDSTRKHASHPPGRTSSIRPNRLLASKDLYSDVPTRILLVTERTKQSSVRTNMAVSDHVNISGSDHIIMTSGYHKYSGWRSYRYGQQ